MKLANWLVVGKSNALCGEGAQMAFTCEICQTIRRFRTVERPRIAGDFWVGYLDGQPAVLSPEGQGTTPVGYRYVSEGEAFETLDHQRVWYVSSGKWESTRSEYWTDGGFIDIDDNEWEWCRQEPPCLAE